MAHDPHLDDARKRIEAAYSPALFRDAGERLVAQLADHLQTVQASGKDVLPWCSPQENIARARQSLDEALAPDCPRDQLAARFAELAETMLSRGHNLHDPRYIGHRVPASLPVGGLFDAIGSVTNQVMAVYDMGPWATAAEWAMVERLGQRIGWPVGEFSGLATHGGSLANLTALLTARNVSMEDSWEKGVSGRAPVLVVHSDAHYSVARSAGILGIGSENVVRVELDQRRRMDPQRLDERLGQLRRQGRPIVAVSACACATPTGAFTLAEIAEVCRRHQVWLTSTRPTAARPFQPAASPPAGRAGPREASSGPTRCSSSPPLRIRPL